ncbi:formylmethanofuran dehydrogenase [Ancylobacter oerskovii]|uniref:Formylmethanofuran dehydrogenase n=1 Tax=Ancylobacter oerskovii TaxID=459519 RepID=A0ABW4Z1V4_9HYPH|nr:formylmethanofuran dehydrogenase [Ancylobacter oerskovii]MBS7544905.1 formylmethanofuran dehydrogenase [Ancylobacter oerskovii]
MNSETGAGAPLVVKDVVCGFCGLGCDDLEVEVAGREVRPRASVCPEAARLLRRLDTGAEAGPASDAVYGRARKLLEAARAPVFAGLGADVDGGRAILDLAARHGGVLDHAVSDGLFANYAAAQRTGWLATTLAEVRNHCDVLLVVGEDPSASFGRFFERALPTDPLFAASRQVIVLGGTLGAAARRQLGAAGVTEIAAEDLTAALSALTQMVAGPAPRGTSFGGAAADALEAAAAALKAAAYAVAVWNAAALEDADLIAERATRLVDALNITTRAGVFPLGGRDNIIGINQLLLWRLGYPLRTAIRGETSEHDSALYATEAALKDADLLVWVSAFRPEPPPAFGGPVIVIGHPDTQFATPPEVFIPVGTPGVDHAGTVFRMDAIVSLPLGALRVATLPSVAEAVRRLEPVR